MRLKVLVEESCRNNMIDELRKDLDDTIKNALNGKELTMGELVKNLDGSDYTVREIKTRVLQLIPQKIELTRELTLKYL